eukprot:jgi/Undpi1/7695/HiC_scaffold_23.g10168.m1
MASSSAAAGVQFEPAGPDPGLTATEVLEYLPTAVAMCSTKTLREALRVYVWGSKAICKVVNEAWVAGNNPFEEGGVYDTEVFYALFELNRIQTQHRSSFVGMCPGLDLVFKYFVEQARQHHQWSTQLVEEVEVAEDEDSDDEQLVEEEPSTEVEGEDSEDEGFFGQTTEDGGDGEWPCHSMSDNDDTASTYNVSYTEDIDFLPANILDDGEYIDADAQSPGPPSQYFADDTSSTPTGTPQSAASETEAGLADETPFLSYEDPTEDRYDNDHAKHWGTTAGHPRSCINSTTGIGHRNPLVWRRRPPKIAHDVGSSSPTSTKPSAAGGREVKAGLASETPVLRRRPDL